MVNMRWGGFQAILPLKPALTACIPANLKSTPASSNFVKAVCFSDNSMSRLNVRLQLNGCYYNGKRENKHPFIEQQAALKLTLHCFCILYFTLTIITFLVIWYLSVRIKIKMQLWEGEMFMKSRTETRSGFDRSGALPVKLFALLALLLITASSAQAGELDIRLEAGGVRFSRNDVQIPGDGGTRFDMLDLTGKGPDLYFRLYAVYDFNDKHALRLTLAPLKVEGTGMLSEDVIFKEDVFTAGTPVKGKYKFNTYRLTYRWTFHDRDRWRWGLGGAVLVRDAEITLEQADKKQSEDDLGLVPLLHLYGEYRFNDKTFLVLDVEGAWSPMGRAVDMALMARHDFSSGWYAAAGYRTLEGGADNDTVYAFAWLHYAQAAVGYRF